MSSVSLEPRPPHFEQLEPRVLLSAELPIPLVLPPMEPSFEWAIVVELESGTDEQKFEVRSEKGEIEDKKVGSEEEKTEDGGTVVRSDGETVVRLGGQMGAQSSGLSTSQLAPSAKLITLQQNKNQSSDASASEDLILNTEHIKPKTDVNLTPETSDLATAQIRGPPSDTQIQENSTVLPEVTYRQSGEIIDRSDSEVINSHQPLAPKQVYSGGLFK